MFTAEKAVEKDNGHYVEWMPQFTAEKAVEKATDGAK